MTENLNHDEKQLDNDLNPDGEGSGAPSIQEVETKALETYNKKLGTSFKSWDDVEKSKKEADSTISKLGQQLKDAGISKPQEVVPSKPDFLTTYEEDIVISRNPKAAFVLEEIKEVCVATGKSMKEVFTSSTWLQNEAESRFQEKQRKDIESGKVSDPSQHVFPGEKGSGLKLSEADKYLLKRRGLTAKDVKN